MDEQKTREETQDYLPQRLELRPGDLALHMVSAKTGRFVMRGWQGKSWGPAFLPFPSDYWEEPLEEWPDLAEVGLGVGNPIAARTFHHLQGYEYIGYAINSYGLPDLFYRRVPYTQSKRYWTI